MARRTMPANHTLTYRITPIDPAAHLFGIELRIARPHPDGQLVTLPAWIPGSYMIRDFARHVVRISARCDERAVALQKLDKQTWQAAPCAGELQIDYQVYAWDLSVRGAHLDDTHGFFNGTSVFLAVVGQTDSPVSVLIEPPPERPGRRWRVATTLPGDGAQTWQFGRYRAADYDELIDHPVEMGDFLNAGFEAGGAHHEIVVSGAPDTDMDRLVRDLKPVCREQIRFFEPRRARAPVARYLFLTYAVGAGYGGLEHRASTALICSRNDLPWRGMVGQPEAYRTFLGLCSHEYFHTWHVKRIKPSAFSPYRLADETYSSLLWVFEGFTSYYDDLMLVRSGVVELPDYLNGLARTISTVLRGSGRLLQSVAESSFDAWTRFYRQDENASNSIVSYYAKGSLVALALDLTIRLRSNHQRSLDDVMRLMWARYGRDFARDGQGIAEGAMPALIREATGLDLRREVQRWAHGTVDLPLAELLGRFGFSLGFEPVAGPGARMGLKLTEQDGRLRIGTVYSAGPGHLAGLSAGDLIVACDGLRIDREKDLQSLLARRADGRQITLHVFRDDRLHSLVLVLAPAPAIQARLSVDPGARDRLDAAARLWLSERR